MAWRRRRRRDEPSTAGVAVKTIQIEVDAHNASADPKGGGSTAVGSTALDFSSTLSAGAPVWPGALVERQRGHERAREEMLQWEWDAASLVWEDELGHGSFGTVNRVRYGEIRLAAKRMDIARNDERKRAEAEDRMLREFRALRKVAHGNVVGLLGVVMDHPAWICLLMELADQGSLRQMLDRSPEAIVGDAAAQAAIAIDVASGLGYCHSLRPPLLHHDIKSANILLFSPGLGTRSSGLTAKLADFGLAVGVSDASTAAATASTTAHAAGGTLAYRAPETFVGKYDVRSEVYSFGIVLWELTTGQRPWHRDPSGAAYMEGNIIHLVMNRSKRPELPPASKGSMLTPVMKRCWSQEPKNRPTFEVVVSQLSPLAPTRVPKRAPTHAESPGRARMRTEVSRLSKKVEELEREQEELSSTRRLLCALSTGKAVALGPPIVPPNAPTAFEPSVSFSQVAQTTYHWFLSHVWAGGGQDVMRVVKVRLLEMLPDARCFLDVDDLLEGRGGEYVDASSVVVVLVSKAYFHSPNCLRELLRAVVTRKPLVALLEMDPTKGAIEPLEVLRRLEDAAAPLTRAGVHHASKYALWGLADEVASWGYELPTAADLFHALFQAPTTLQLEWSRLPAFQDVTMRLLAEGLLPHGHGGTFMPGEATTQEKSLALPPPREGRRFHLFCSAHNAGALELAHEVARECGLDVRTTHDESAMHECERVLVYLTERTWTSGATSEAFAAHVERAMGYGVPLMLCHEMPGLGQEQRGACPFEQFFECERGATPAALLERQVYGKIALTFKGGAWRRTSIVLFAQALSAGVGKGKGSSAGGSGTGTGSTASV